MNVLYFHQHFSTPEGSTGNRSYEMASRLIARGHHVTMVCGSYGGGETGLTTSFKSGRRCGVVEGIHIIEFDLAYANKDGLVKRAFTFLKFAWYSISLIFTQSYDVVFATSTPLTAGIPGIVARWFRRKTFLFEVRDLWPELPKAMGVVKNPFILSSLRFLERVTYRSARHIIGLSPGIVEGIHRQGVPRECISMISNGCDLDVFVQPVVHWRPEGVDEHNLMAVYAGTHGIANGLDAVVDAAIELQARGRTDITFVLVGQGKLKASLEARAQKANLSNIIFHEPVNKKCLAGLLAAADIGLQILANVEAFYDGTSPNKFFDYLSSGLPVLINYPGWLTDVVLKNQCGFAVPPEDASAFADALEEAAGNRAALKSMGHHAYQLAKNQFDRITLANQFVDCFEAYFPKMAQKIEA